VEVDVREDGVVAAVLDVLLPGLLGIPEGRT
jgi:hypothetical protein